MSWKYGLIKINHESIFDTDDYCELVEVYLDEDGTPKGFCKARINSIEELNMAHGDVLRNGINTWFAENGTFSVSKEDEFWNWTINCYLDKALSDNILDEYEEEIDLYKVYGGD